MNADFPTALDAYTKMGEGDVQAALVASIGLADLALYRQGRYADAIGLLRDRVVKDRKTTDSAWDEAVKLLLLAEAYQAEGRPALALDAVRTALKVGPRTSRFLSQRGDCCRVLARNPKRWRWRPNSVSIWSHTAAPMRPRSRNHRRATAKADRRRTRFRALNLTDYGLRGFDLGVAYVGAGYPAEGLTELELCLKRRGEGSALFLTMCRRCDIRRPPDWLARAQEGVGLKERAAQNYKTYLQIRSAAAARDPLAADARRRLRESGSSCSYFLAVTVIHTLAIAEFVSSAPASVT